jgi:hypothetical protein
VKQQNKNIVLLIVLAVLVAACFWSMQFNPYQRSSSQRDIAIFSVENAVENLSKVVFIGAKFENKLVRTNKGWTVNDSLSLDPAMQQVLVALLEKVEVQRVIEGSKATEILQQLADTGVQVKLYANEQLINEFTVGGNPKQVSTYFGKEGKAYLMQLPGYESYVAGMFEVKTLDWKNRSVFNGTWQDVVSLSLQYANGDSLYFQYEKGLVKLQNRTNADSVKVMDYIETYNYFYVDQYLPATHEAVRKVKGFDVAGSITIKALDTQKDLKMEFFTHPEFNAVLVRINGKDWAGIQKNRFTKYFPEVSHFLKD